MTTTTITTTKAVLNRDPKRTLKVSCSTEIQKQNNHVKRNSVMNSKSICFVGGGRKKRKKKDFFLCCLKSFTLQSPASHLKGREKQQNGMQHRPDELSPTVDSV